MEKELRGLLRDAGIEFRNPALFAAMWYLRWGRRWDLLSCRTGVLLIRWMLGLVAGTKKFAAAWQDRQGHLGKVRSVKVCPTLASGRGEGRVLFVTKLTFAFVEASQLAPK